MKMTLIIETDTDPPNFQIKGAVIKQVISRDITEEINESVDLPYYEDREYQNRYGNDEGGK